MRARLLIEYDGGAFAGWSRQPGQRTVQAELERALAVVLRRVEDPPALTVAGRTDTGVHALGQVASYDGAAASPRSLNALLPADVSVLDCRAATPDFDARRDATSRLYCYRVLLREARSALSPARALHWPRPLDREALDACAAALLGTHDFTAFTPSETYHVRFQRDVHGAEWRGDGELLVFWIEADSFMRNMNRILVGTMLQVASGSRSVAGFRELLSGAPREAAGPTAAPHGLYLAAVGYGGESLLTEERTARAAPAVQFHR